MRILISRKASDYAFVAASISKFKLSSKVKERPATVNDGEMRRIVEKYAWGDVMFTYRPDGDSTIVLVLEKASPVGVQECVGFAAEKDEPGAAECHGDATSRPCAFKAKCQAVKRTAEKLGLSVDTLLLRCSVEDVVAGKATAAEVVEAPQPSRRRSATKRSAEPKMLDAEAQLVRKATAFLKEVGAKAGRSVLIGASAAGRREFDPGQVYVRDRMGSSGYVGLYVYNDGWDDPVCVLRPVPRRMVYHVKVPVTEAQFNKLDLENACGDLDRKPADKASRFKFELKSVSVEKLPTLVKIFASMLQRSLTT
jgi:hypothetical protein